MAQPMPDYIDLQEGQVLVNAEGQIIGRPGMPMALPPGMDPQMIGPDGRPVPQMIGPDGRPVPPMMGPDGM